MEPKTHLLREPAKSRALRKPMTGYNVWPAQRCPAFTVRTVGLACGIIAALRKNTMVDHAISAMVVFNVSVPAFVFASLLQYIFAYKLEWFPFLLNLDPQFSFSKFASMILPILALSFGGIATITRYMRAELFEALNSEYRI